MHIPNTRKLCTLSSFFRSNLDRKPKIEASIPKTASSPKPQHASTAVDSPDTDAAATASILHFKRLLFEENGKEEKGKRLPEIPWVPDPPTTGDITLKRKEVFRVRKQKWMSKYTNQDHSDKLLRKCAKRLGSKATVEVLGHLGQETGLKEG